jgi:hypothetical protein
MLLRLGEVYVSRWFVCRRMNGKTFFREKTSGVKSNVKPLINTRGILEISKPWLGSRISRKIFRLFRTIVV